MIEDKDIYNQEENQTRHIRNLSDAKLEEEARKVSNYNKKWLQNMLTKRSFASQKQKYINVPVVLVNFNILKNISKFLQNVVVLDLIRTL